MIAETFNTVTEYTIYVEHCANECFDFISNSFECGLTIVGGRGQWLGDGCIEEEDSFVITIMSDDTTMRSQIRTFCNDYAKEYSQEQIIWSEREVNLISREYRK